MFVDKFYETDFKKLSKVGSMGAKIFDYTEILKSDSLPEDNQIAKKLKNKTWEKLFSIYSCRCFFYA
ncbi:hypothetical protein HMPREF0077_0750 [Anaerococcus tetradius ATCC 35098]|jgi:hypothetical protein|uniref:Uncharacterized protein n=2 Tax=Anaerococcus tetradius TaxID=33036 RepID=C2CGZ0_9FIRM|nr:hypothetical protein HMPREF0077_0750 [Anaerococcus tetradius ATCC 35098]KWZ76357.1 hypothetical protein HMPREF3200_01856 [Anaerococcus tetradius]